jgi:integrase
LIMRGEGFTETVLDHTNWKLRQIARNTDIFNPEAVKQYIATAKKKTSEPIGNETKNKTAYAYHQFCERQNITWTKPYYRVEEKTPIIPTPESVNAIINTATEKYTIIFKLLAEIGADGKELQNVSQDDIDAEQGVIRVRGVKGHNSGTYKLKPQIAEMLRVYLSKNPQEHPFPSSEAMGDQWRDTRRRAAKKLCKPELDKIELKSLRNYSGAQLYLSMPIRDPIAVMRHLRHKKLETTMHYIRGMALSNEPEDYICRIATDVKQASELIEKGFTYVTGEYKDGGKLFRKRK